MTNAAENSDSNNDSFKTKKITEAHYHQISILRAMCLQAVPTVITPTGTDKVTGKKDKVLISTEPRQFDIDEISEKSGINDEKEVQRYLFILEGQKLVTPHPEGDFTSKIWKITRTGMKALRTINKSTVNQ